MQPNNGIAVQVKALEAADAARRKEAAKNADRIKQKGTLDKQRAQRAKVLKCSPRLACTKVFLLD